MKFASLFAAALVAVTGVSAAPAAAQERVVVRERTVAPARERVVVRERTVVRRDRGWHNRVRRICRVRYRHGERIRTCRTRYRY